MKKSLLIIIVLTTFMHSYAASLRMESNMGNDSLLHVLVFVEPDGQTINAVSGTFSFPTSYFDLGSISTVDSVVPLWLESPKISTAIDFTGLKHIHFEGIIPGGFEGIRSPYYEGAKGGLVMAVTLSAKQTGEPAIVLENLEVRLNDGNATAIITPTQSTLVTLSESSIQKVSTKKNPKLIDNVDLKTFVVHNELIGDDKWSLLIEDDTTRNTIDHYEVAESRKYDPATVSFYEWREIKSPAVLTYQKRNTFIHTKAVYVDGTYAFSTIAPVENVNQDSLLSRILIGIALALFVLYILYALSRKSFYKPHR